MKQPALKGFRQPPKPTKAEVEKENQTLGQQLSQRVQGLQQFFGNLINQLMRQSQTHDQELSMVSQWMASKEVDAGAEKGDHLLMDYAGLLLNDDGSAATVEVETAEGKKSMPDYFEGGSGKLFMLANLGGGTLIPGFEEQLVGLKAGEGKEITVQFPKEYGVKSLQDKKAKFTVFVHQVRRTFKNSAVGDLIEENERIRKAAREKAIADAQAKKIAAQKKEELESTPLPENKGPGADSVPSGSEGGEQAVQS